MRKEGKRRHKSKGSLECRSSLGGRPTFIGQKTSLNRPQSTLKTWRASEQGNSRSNVRLSRTNLMIGGR